MVLSALLLNLRDWVPLLCFRIVKLNVLHGMSQAMPSAVALYGIIVARCPRCPLTEAKKWADIAHTLHKRLSNDSEPATIMFRTFGNTYTLTEKLSKW